MMRSSREAAAVVALVVCIQIGSVLSHSWVACTDYRGTVTGLAGDYTDANCFGFPRNWDGSNLAAISTFGVDRGFNYQPNSNGNVTCRDPKTGVYPANFPKAQYTQGASVRILWPAKNHARVRDFGLRVYACCEAHCTALLEQQISNLAAPGNLVMDFGVNTNGGMIGFGGNCPNLSDTDKAVCFGDFTIPASLQGACTFVWDWPFNSDQDIYTTCWEADVVASGSSTVSPVTLTPTTIAPTSLAPTTGPTTLAPTASGSPTTSAPSTLAPTFAPGTCPNGPYAQCGGTSFQSSSNCCSAGYQCSVLNAYYSQCVPSTNTSPCQNGPWSQCGGSNFQGQTCCSAGFACSAQNEFYSQCLPITQASVAGLASSGNECPNAQYEQCGGENFNGATCCSLGSVCSVQNEFFSQCIPIPSVNTAELAVTCTNGLYDQCDGSGFDGSTCCSAGTTCIFYNNFYSRCEGLPPTVAPTTKAPTTLAPTTRPPTIKAPTTSAPTTNAPTTLAPTTRPPTTSPPTLPPSTPTPTVACSNQLFDQCNGQNFQGNKCCPSGTTCTFYNAFYSRCESLTPITMSPTSSPSPSASAQPTLAPSGSPTPASSGGSGMTGGSGGSGTSGNTGNANSCRNIGDQCGGSNYTGSTCCSSGAACQFYNGSYSACVNVAQAASGSAAAANANAITPASTMGYSLVAFVSLAGGAVITGAIFCAVQVYYNKKRGKRNGLGHRDRVFVAIDPSY